MSISETENNISKIPLTVLTGDDTTEVFIIDNKLNLVTQGLGSSFKTFLESGIYKIKVRSGLQTEEKLIILPEGSSGVSIKFEPLKFASPAPLLATGQTHEYHMYNAEKFSRPENAMFKSGAGSAIFIFARFWRFSVEESDRLNQTEKTSPTRGLYLCTENGEFLENIDSVSVKDLSEEDPWAAFHAVVSPGNYRIRLHTADNLVLEQIIVAAEGWQTQVFLMQRDYGKNKIADFRADLPGASIIMSKLNKGFRTIDSISLRTDELARIALNQGREIVTEVFKNQLLEGKYQNPLFGVYGAHLILLDQNPDYDLLEIVVGNLRRLLGTKHPDVEALALRTPTQGNPNFIFHTPPMLRRSWAVVVEETSKRAKIVPFGSLAEKISTHIWGSECFLVWIEEYSSETLGRRSKKSSNLYRTALKQHIRILSSQKPEIEVFRRDLNFSSNFDAIRVESNSGALSTRNSNLSDQVGIKRGLVSELVKSLGLPQATIRRMLNSKKIKRIHKS